MGTSLGTYAPRANLKRASRRSVFLRFAKLQGISPLTARDIFSGHLPNAAFAVTADAVRACAELDRWDMVAEIQQQTIEVPTMGEVPDWETARHEYDQADNAEGTDQADFDHRERIGLATRADWVKRRQKVADEVARALRYIAAGNEKFGL